MQVDDHAGPDPFGGHFAGCRCNEPTSVRITLIHASATTAQMRRQVADPDSLSRCSPAENLLDVLIEDRSILEVGKNLPDPVRVVDLYVLQRLILGSRWQVPMPLHRLCDTITDPASFVFAQDLIRRGYEELSRDALKNSIKRLRAALRFVYPSSINWFIRYEGARGYLFDVSHICLELVHIPL